MSDTQDQAKQDGTQENDLSTEQLAIVNAFINMLKMGQIPGVKPDFQEIDVHEAGEEEPRNVLTEGRAQKGPVEGVVQGESSKLSCRYCTRKDDDE